MAAIESCVDDSWEEPGWECCYIHDTEEGAVSKALECDSRGDELRLINKKNHTTVEHSYESVENA